MENVAAMLSPADVQKLLDWTRSGDIVWRHSKEWEESLETTQGGLRIILPKWYGGFQPLRVLIVQGYGKTFVPFGSSTSLLPLWEIALRVCQEAEIPDWDWTRQELTKLLLEET